MRFVYGVKTNNGIEVYSRGFNTLERVMDSEPDYHTTVKDKSEYKHSISNLTYTDIDVFDTQYKSRTGFYEACKKFIMEIIDPNTSYSQKMWCIKKDIEDKYSRAKYKYTEYCWVDYVKPYVEGNSVGFWAETIGVRVRENLNTRGIDFVDMENCPCNEHIIDDILNGEATKVPNNSENMNRIKEFMQEYMNRFCIRLFRGFKK